MTTERRREREQRELADLMRRVMAERDWTSAQLGEELGYHEVVIRQWVNLSKPMSARARKVVRKLLAPQAA